MVTLGTLILKQHELCGWSCFVIGDYCQCHLPKLKRSVLLHSILEDTSIGFNELIWEWQNGTSGQFFFYLLKNSYFCYNSLLVYPSSMCWYMQLPACISSWLRPCDAPMKSSADCHWFAAHACVVHTKSTLCVYAHCTPKARCTCMHNTHQTWASRGKKGLR